ncbi:MAG: hypothetical protein ACTSVL_07420 [Promethearchaeota archaeon]
MDIDKELIGLRIFLANYQVEMEKTFGSTTLKAILFRMGQKPGNIIADEILKKYNRTVDTPFDLPAAAFSLFENTITKLYNAEILSREESNDKIIIKIKNICAFRRVIKNRDELPYGGTLCEFSAGYFETALKKLTGMNVEYKFNEKETSDDYCVIDIIFSK